MERFSASPAGPTRWRLGTSDIGAVWGSHTASRPLLLKVWIVKGAPFPLRCLHQLNGGMSGVHPTIFCFFNDWIRGLTYNMTAVSAREDAPRQFSLFFPPIPLFSMSQIIISLLHPPRPNNVHIARRPFASGPIDACQVSSHLTLSNPPSFCTWSNLDIGPPK